MWAVISIPAAESGRKMVRAYKMKGQKRKKKEEKYDKGEEFERLDERVAPPSPKKVKTEGSESEKEEKMEPVTDEMPGIPIVPVDTGSKKPGVIFVLEKASLEIAKVGKVCLREGKWKTFMFFVVYAVLYYMGCVIVLDRPTSF